MMICGLKVLDHDSNIFYKNIVLDKIFLFYIFENISGFKTNNLEICVLTIATDVTQHTNVQILKSHVKLFSSFLTIRMYIIKIQ